MKPPEKNWRSVRKLAMILGLCLFAAHTAAAGDPPADPGRNCNPILKPRPECLPPPATRPLPPAQPARPSRELTQEEIARDKQRQRERAERAAGIPLINLTPEEIEKEVQWAKEHAGITLKDKGTTQTSFEGGVKGSIFLDDEKYPVRLLKLTCDPPDAAGLTEPIYGSRGPDLYPVWIITVLPGKCVLRNKDFVVNIVIEELPEGEPTQ